MGGSLTTTPLVGVLALQGGFAAHRKILKELGVNSQEVRTISDLAAVSALIIPGGESTTIMMGLEREGLIEPIRERVRAGMPIMGTCAGLIVLSKGYLNLIDIEVERNAYGRQISSFEAQFKLSIEGEHNFNGIFIRAPQVKRVGDEVKVLAKLESLPVALLQNRVLVTSFHPELSENVLLHQWLIKS